MNGTVREWKAEARRALNGKWVVLILAQILIAGVTGLAGNLTGLLFPGTGIWNLVLSQLFSFIVTLVISVFTAGLYYMYLNIARGKTYSFGDMFYFFKNNPDRVIAASFVLALIAWITSFPSEYYLFTAPMGETLEQQMVVLQEYLRLSYLGIFMNIFLSIPFSLSYFILADHGETGGFGALKGSLQMMKGRMMKYILLQLSFFPWFLLGIFTMGIALFVMMPYMQMADVMFYRDISGE